MLEIFEALSRRQFWFES